MTICSVDPISVSSESPILFASPTGLISLYHGRSLLAHLRNLPNEALLPGQYLYFSTRRPYFKRLTFCNFLLLCPEAGMAAILPDEFDGLKKVADVDVAPFVKAIFKKIRAVENPKPRKLVSVVIFLLFSIVPLTKLLPQALLCTSLCYISARYRSARRGAHAVALSTQLVGPTGRHIPILLLQTRAPIPRPRSHHCICKCLPIGCV